MGLFQADRDRACYLYHPSSPEPYVRGFDPGAHFLILIITFIILFVLSLVRPLSFTYREGQLVREKGTLVPAVIRDVADTAIFINKQPVPDMTLTVHPRKRLRSGKMSARSSLFKQSLRNSQE